MFNVLKSMLSKVWDYIPYPQTTQQRNLLSSYKKDLRQELRKTEKKVSTRLTAEQKQQKKISREQQQRHKKLEKE